VLIESITTNSGKIFQTIQKTSSISDVEIKSISGILSFQKILFARLET